MASMPGHTLPEINSSEDLYRYLATVARVHLESADAFGNLRAHLTVAWRHLAIPTNGRFSSPVRNTVAPLGKMASASEIIARECQVMARRYQANIYDPIHAAGAAKFKV